MLLLELSNDLPLFKEPSKYISGHTPPNLGPSLDSQPIVELSILFEYFCLLLKENKKVELSFLLPE